MLIFTVFFTLLRNSDSEIHFIILVFANFCIMINQLTFLISFFCIFSLLKVIRQFSSPSILLNLLFLHHSFFTPFIYHSGMHLVMCSLIHLFFLSFIYSFFNWTYNQFFFHSIILSFYTLSAVNSTNCLVTRSFIHSSIQLAQVFIFHPPSEVRLVNRLKTIAALEGLYVTGDRI